MAKSNCGLDEKRRGWLEVNAEILSIAGRLMRCPAVPYHEELPASEVARICGDHQLDFRMDRFGNILVELNAKASARPLILAAHLDHPGFVLRNRISKKAWRAEFLGSVGDAWFQKGTKLRLIPGNARGRLGKKFEPRIFEIQADPDAAEARFAVWDLPDFRIWGGKIHGRACDDLIGAAAILAVLIELRRRESRARVIGALSRAEEVGFQGALALAESNELPKNALLISLETSRELPPVRMGGGVILRVGDRASIFDSTATRFLWEVAEDLAKEDRAFRFQRALMSGGTCEGTAYQERGFQTAAVCVALGNYHNCGPRGKIRAEYVSGFDAATMAQLLVQAANRLTEFDRLAGRLLARLVHLAEEARRKLSCSFTLQGIPLEVGKR